MITYDQLTRIGSLLKPHGIKGEIVAELDFDIDLTQLSCIVLDMDGIFVPFFLESVRPRSSHSSLVLINDVMDENKAKELCGKEFYALSGDLDAEFMESLDDGFFLSDLIGFTLIEKSLGEIGEIIDFDDSTENCLLIIKPKREGESNIFIPLAPELITEVSEKDRVVEMDLPEGIIYLN